MIASSRSRSAGLTIRDASKAITSPAVPNPHAAMLAPMLLGPCLAAPGLVRFMADRNDICSRLPYFRPGQHFTPTRHAEAATLPTVGDGLEHVIWIAQIAIGQVDPAIAVRTMTMRAMFLQVQLATSRDHLGIFEVRYSIIIRAGGARDANNQCTHNHCGGRWYRIAPRCCCRRRVHRLGGARSL